MKTTARRKRTTAERFWAKVDKDQIGTGCWVWQGAWVGEGYGRFYPTSNIGVLAHRWAYEDLVGPIPEGLESDHLCRNKRCVNPAHLECVTHQENCRRAFVENNPVRAERLGRHQREKTHCPRGHPYSGENLIVAKHVSGGLNRLCRACRRELGRQRQREYRARKRRGA